MTLKYHSIVTALLFSALFASTSGTAQQTKLAVQSGEKIAFLGDSITANGARKNGYINLVMDALKQQDLDLTHVPAGKGGHRSNDMLKRLDADVLSKNPQWMLLSCGVNDVWHYKLKLGNRTFEGVPLEDFKTNITAIIEKAQTANIKVMVLTATMIGEDPTSELNQNLIPYNDFLRQIAAEKNCLLADLSKDMHEALKQIPDEEGKAKMFGDPQYERNIKNKLTSDGCHMNAKGNIMMAKGILRAFGMTEDQIAISEKSWAGSE